MRETMLLARRAVREVWRLPAATLPAVLLARRVPAFKATGPLRSRSYSVSSASSLVPITWMSKSFSSLSVRARLVTMM